MANNFDWMDPSKRATDVLNSVLSKKSTSQEEGNEAEQQPVEDTPHQTDAVDISEARSGTPILEYVSDRQSARLLLITKDITVLTEGSFTYRRITDLSSQFLEVHVLVLNVRGEEELPIARPFENVWMYPTNASSWWMLPYVGYRVAQSQLEFGGGFRADLIVAEDPAESGLVAKFLGAHYVRPYQLHLYEDFFDTAFVEAQEHPTLYSWCSSYTLEHATSVRTKTEFQRQAAVNINSNLEANSELLPTYYSLDSWRDIVPTLDLHTRYPQFKFILLHISSMRKGSHTSEIISGVGVILKRYPTIGLVIVGSGPLRALYEKQAIAQGVQGQIEFEPMPPEVISHMKSANVFIHLSEEGSEDELILMAATSKVPLIVNKNGIGGKLFTEGESALLCAPDDVACITDAVNRYLNENQDRTHLALNAYEAVFSRVEQDYESYLKAYAGSIQRSGVLES